MAIDANNGSRIGHPDAAGLQRSGRYRHEPEKQRPSSIFREVARPNADRTQTLPRVFECQ